MLEHIFTWWAWVQFGVEFAYGKVGECYELLCHLALRTLLTPYLFAKFAPPWYYPYSHKYWYFEKEWRPLKKINKPSVAESEPAWVFIRQFGEGAWVALSLLRAAYDGYKKGA